jgi:hypothetical protein
MTHWPHAAALAQSVWHGASRLYSPLNKSILAACGPCTRWLLGAVPRAGRSDTEPETNTYLSSTGRYIPSVIDSGLPEARDR